MAKQGKRLRAAWALVKPEQVYGLDEAVTLLRQFPKAKFDESVDLAVRLGVDPRKAEENVRGTVSLPHGTGKNVRVVAFCKGDKVKEALEAGADVAGAEDLVARIQEGWFGFDAVVATPDVMVLVGKIGKLLGPRGLMPNPKVGTVTPDVAKAVRAIKSGRVEYRVEKAGIVHVGAGRCSFSQEQISENLRSVIDSLIKAKPAASKGTYLESLCISTTMGPSITIDAVPFRS